MEENLKFNPLQEFHALADYLTAEGRINDAAAWRKDFRAYVSFLKRFKAYAAVAPICRGKKVLDLGCFFGHGSRLLAEQAEAVISVDSDRRALAAAKRRTGRKNARFALAEAKRLPFPDGTFGAVVAFHLIEHLPPGEVEAFLREARRVTVGGGQVFLTTPNRSFRLLPFQRPFNPEHRQEFTARRLRSVLSSIFPGVEIKGLRGKAWVEEVERKRLRSSPFRVYLRDPLAALIKWACPALGRKWRTRMKSPSANGRVAGLNTRERGPNLDDYQFDDREPDRGIDLMAVCRKTRT